MAILQCRRLVAQWRALRPRRAQERPGVGLRDQSHGVSLFLWHHELALYVFAVLGGLSWLATPPSVIALTGEIYGMRALGTLGGISLLAQTRLVVGPAFGWLARCMI